MIQSSSPAPLPSVPARVVQASWGIVCILTVASLLGTATSPLLLVKAPLLLVALAPDGRHVALAAGRVDPWLLLCVSVARRTVFGVALYALGAAYGDVAIGWVEARARRVGKALRVVERLFAKLGAPLLLITPFLALCVLAGAARMRFLLVLPALILGHCLWAGTTVWLGTRFADSAQVVVDFFATRLLESTLVCCALVAAHQLYTRRKRAPPTSP